jgi:DNA-binding IclR family transcriptional regulator
LIEKEAARMSMRVDGSMPVEEGSAGRTLLGAERHAEVAELRRIADGCGYTLSARDSCPKRRCTRGCREPPESRSPREP